MKKIFRGVLWVVLAMAIVGVLGGIADVFTNLFATSVGFNSGETKESLAQSVLYLFTEIIHLFVIGSIFLWVRRQQSVYLSFAAYSLIANMVFDFISLAVPRAVQEARSEGLPEWLFEIGPVFDVVPPGIGSGLFALVLFYVEKEYRLHPYSGHVS